MQFFFSALRFTQTKKREKIIHLDIYEKVVSEGITVSFFSVVHWNDTGEEVKIEIKWNRKTVCYARTDRSHIAFAFFNNCRCNQ